MAIARVQNGLYVPKHKYSMITLEINFITFFRSLYEAMLETVIDSSTEETLTATSET